LRRSHRTNLLAETSEQDQLAAVAGGVHSANAGSGAHQSDTEKAVLVQLTHKWVTKTKPKTS